MSFKGLFFHKKNVFKPHGIKFLTFSKYVLANLCFTMISVLLLIVGINILGFGDPNLLSLGRVIYHVRVMGGLATEAWWMYVLPTGLIFTCITGLFLIGSSLDDT